MNPYVIYAMVAFIIIAGYLFMKYLEWHGSNKNSTMPK